jgi:hypothetical protein
VARIYYLNSRVWVCEASARIFFPRESSNRSSTFNACTRFFPSWMICVTTKAFRLRSAGQRNLSRGDRFYAATRLCDCHPSPIFATPMARRPRLPVRAGAASPARSSMRSLRDKATRRGVRIEAASAILPISWGRIRSRRLTAPSRTTSPKKPENEHGSRPSSARPSSPLPIDREPPASALCRPLNGGVRTISGRAWEP